MYKHALTSFCGDSNAGWRARRTHWHSLHSSHAKIVGSSEYFRPLMVLMRWVMPVNCKMRIHL